MKKEELTEERIRELLRCERILNAFYTGGIDNWEWYGESLEEIYAEEEKENNKDIK